MTLVLRYRIIEKKNLHGSMEISFFVVCPLRNCECKAPKIGMNCNQSFKILFPFDSSQFSGQLSRIYKACPPRPEPGTGSGGATLRIPFLVCNEYGIFSVILSPRKPGLGQGHTKKRLPHVPCKKRHLHTIFHIQLLRRGYELDSDLNRVLVSFRYGRSGGLKHAQPS